MEYHENYILSSVKNALQLLRTFSLEETEKGITEFAKSLNLGKSTVQRLVATLASEGFLEKSPTSRKYRLGLSILNLSGIIISSNELYNQAMPVLRKLVESVGETAHIAILDGLNVVYLLKVECNHPVRCMTYLGSRNPLYSTSSGKVILAHQDQSVIDQVIRSGLKRYAANTITDPNLLLKELKKIKEQGYASDVNENMDGIISVAAPVRDFTRKVVAAVNIVGPIQRMDPIKISYYAEKVMKAGMEISRELGFYQSGKSATGV
jgi:DNA-binding IclR family transcriptional regulator